MELNRNSIISFGKYKGKIVLEVLKDDPGYLLWMEENVGGYILSDGVFFEAKRGVRETTPYRPDSGDLCDIY